MYNIRLICVITYIQAHRPRKTMKEGVTKGKYRQCRWNYAVLYNLDNLVSAFAKLRKGTISCIMYACPSVRMQQLGSHLNFLDRFSKILTYQIFRKSVQKIQVEKYGTAWQATEDNIIRCRRFACWIPKAKNTHSEYVILIAFPRRQWFREGVS